MKLSERLEARAAFEDNRVLDEAKAMGFVPEVYTGSHTGALLREAAELARRVEDAPVGRVDMICAADAVVVDELPESTLYAINKQRVRIVPEQGEGESRE